MGDSNVQLCKNLLCEEKQFKTERNGLCALYTLSDCTASRIDLLYYLYS